MTPLRELAATALADPNLKGNARTWATPYLQAMLSLDSIHDTYHYDTGEDVVIYAMANLTYWRGDTAKAVKAELRNHLGR